MKVMGNFILDEHIASRFQTVTIGANREWEDIRSIAYMCPDTVGQAVYEAQSLMMLVDEYIDSDTSCSTLVLRSEKDQKSGEVIVFPNPGSGIFTFDLGKNSLISSICIFTIDGKEIAKVNTSGQEIIRFDASELQHGVYYYQCLTYKDNLHSGKIVIIK